ncbi:MAG TPA: hypothetical protein VFH13_05055, partial [Gemmatimonadaceae bacterium]|nr:hypothetical protein [Gemmatimonadaceae bacterium]
GHHVIPKIRRMPLAEATNDQTAVSWAAVEPRQHVAAPVFKPSLKIPRTAQDFDRVFQSRSVLRRCRMKPSLGSGIVAEHHDGKQGDPDSSAQRDARAVDAT